MLDSNIKIDIQELLQLCHNCHQSNKSSHVVEALADEANLDIVWYLAFKYMEDALLIEMVFSTFAF